MRSAADQSAFDWVQRWYVDHVDGDWEHQDGVEIATLDNRGWSLRTDIAEPELSGRAFDAVTIERSGRDRVHARVRNGKFEALGGPGNLSEMLACFRRWAEERPRPEAE